MGPEVLAPLRKAGAEPLLPKPVLAASASRAEEMPRSVKAAGAVLKTLLEPIRAPSAQVKPPRPSGPSPFAVAARAEAAVFFRPDVSG